MSDFVSSVFALLEQLGDKVEGWGHGFALMLPNIVAATIVLVTALIASRMLARGACRLLVRAHAPKTLRDLLYKIVRVVVVVVGGIVALQILELDKAATTFLAGAGIIGIALGFAFQDLSANFIAGVVLAVRRPMGIGDLVETNGVFGCVEAIHLRTTSLRSPDGKLVIVPNRRVFETQLINYSDAGKLRVDVRVGVAYDDDLEVARSAALEALSAVPRLEDEPVEVFYEGFGDSSIDLIGRFWVDYAGPRDVIAARSEAVTNIKAAFDQRGITIPFPIRTLDVDDATAASLAGRAREAA